MAVTWNWNHKIGEITYEGTNGVYIVNNIYAGGNSLAVVLNEYKDRETEEDCYTLAFFFCDKEHAKRCLGLAGKDSENIFGGDCAGTYTKISLNTYYKEARELAGLFLKAHSTMPDLEMDLYYYDLFDNSES